MASTRKDRTKFCHHCKQAEDTLFRVRYTIDKQWYFLCKSCVELKKKDNPLYQYGGTWKK